LSTLTTVADWYSCFVAACALANRAPDTSTSDIKFFFISPPGEWLKRMLTQSRVTGNGNQFIACNSELVSALGSKLDQAALEPRVQAKLPQSISTTGVEFKAVINCKGRRSQQEGGGRL